MRKPGRDGVFGRPLPTVGIGGANARFASGTDIISLGQTNIDSLHFDGSTIAQGVDFIVDEDFAVGFIGFIENAQDVLVPLGDGGDGLGGVFGD